MRKTIIITSIVGVSAIALGITGGYFLHSFLAGGTIENADAGTGANDYSSIAKIVEAKKGSDYTASLSPRQMVTYAINSFIESPSFFAEGIGVASAGSLATQEIRSHFVHTGNQYFEESLSHSSFVDLADRMYQTGDSTVTYHGGTNNGNVEEGVFPDKSTTYSNTDYATKYGRKVSDVCSYTIADDYVVKAGEKNLKGTTSGDEPTGSVKTDEGYTVYLELDAYYSVGNYKIQMQAISSLAQLPSFQFVHLTFNLDSELKLLKLTTHEYYYAKTSAGVGSNIDGRLVTTYATDGEYTVPELNTPLPYTTGE